MKSSNPLQCWPPAKFSEIPKSTGKMHVFLQGETLKIPQFCLAPSRSAFLKKSRHFFCFLFLCMYGKTDLKLITSLKNITWRSFSIEILGEENFLKYTGLFAIAYLQSACWPKSHSTDEKKTQKFELFICLFI